MEAKLKNVVTAVVFGFLLIIIIAAVAGALIGTTATSIATLGNTTYTDANGASQKVPLLSSLMNPLLYIIVIGIVLVIIYAAFEMLKHKK
jgi:glycerol uptake facilitator-like aquaporin